MLALHRKQYFTQYPRRLFMRYKIYCLVFLITVFLPATVFPWGSLFPGETHQFVIDAAYTRLKADPAYAVNIFPTQSAIKGHEGVQWTANGLFGVGPDGAGMSTYSEHYYNPITGDGNGPNAAARYFSTLIRCNITGKANSEAGAKSAAYSAHFLADMFVPYHTVGASRKRAEKIWVEQNTAHSGTINLGTSITGSSKLSYLTPFKGGNNNFHTELSRFITLTDPPEVDWFDPWYFNGNTDTMMIKTSSHVAWEAIANRTPIITFQKRAGQGLSGYDPQWKNSPITGFKQNAWDSQSGQVRLLAIQSATETRGKLEAYFEDPTPALKKTIQSVYTIWRASFSGLRPTIEYQPDGPNNYKVVGKIENYAGAPVSSVRTLLTATDCKVSGQGEVALSGSISPKGKTATPPWRVETTDKQCRLNLQVIGSYPIPDLQYAAVERTFIPEQSKMQPTTGTVTASLVFFGNWDRGYNNPARNRVFRQRYWYDLGTMGDRHPMRGTVTRDGFRAKLRIPWVDAQKREIPGCYREEEIVGRIVGDMLAEVRYTITNREQFEEEKAEFVAKDIPLDRDSSRGSGRVFRLMAAHPVTGAVTPDFGKHIVKLEHQFTFFEKDKQILCRLQSNDWGYSESGIGGFRQIQSLSIYLSAAK